jgi:hypothetical protein
VSHDQLLILLSVAVPIVLVALGMAIGWRTRRRRQGDVIGLAPVPAPVDGEPVLLAEDLFYVATTRAEAPLDRIAVKGLGFRSRAELTVTSAGLELVLTGQEPGFIPQSSLIGVGRATWTIDRVISNDGLVFVRWTQDGGAAFDSYFRSADPAVLVETIEKLVPEASTNNSGATA